MKDNIIGILKKYTAFDLDDEKEAKQFNRMADDFKNLVNLEVEKRIAERKLSKSDVDRIIELIHQAEEMPFVTARFGDNWKNHARNEYTFEDVIHIAWKQGRRAILLERELHSRLTNPGVESNQKTEHTPQVTPQVPPPRRKEVGDERL